MTNVLEALDNQIRLLNDEIAQLKAHLADTQKTQQSVEMSHFEVIKSLQEDNRKLKTELHVLKNMQANLQSKATERPQDMIKLSIDDNPVSELPPTH